MKLWQKKKKPDGTKRSKDSHKDAGSEAGTQNNKGEKKTDGQSDQK